MDLNGVTGTEDQTFTETSLMHKQNHFEIKLNSFIWDWT